MSKVYNRSGKTLIVDRVIERGVHGQNPVAPIMSMINVAMNQKQIDDIEKSIEDMATFGVTPSEKATLYATWSDVQSSYQNICNVFDNNEDFSSWVVYDDLKDAYTTLYPLMRDLLANMNETSWDIDMKLVAESLGNCIELLNECNNAYQGSLEFNKRYDITIEGDRTINTTRNLTVKIYDNTSKQFIGLPESFTMRYYRSSDNQEIVQDTTTSTLYPTFDISDLNGELSCEFYAEMARNWTGGYSTRKVLFFTLSVGGLKQYLWSNGETEDEINKNDASWDDEQPPQPANMRYLWVRESTDNGKTWTYYRSTGTSGWSQATVQLFTKSATIPASFDGGAVTYDFETGALSGDLGSWSTNIPEGDDDVYTIYGSFRSQNRTATLQANEWTIPTLVHIEGTQGEPGISALSINIYIRREATPSLPTTDAYFNFSSNVLTGINPWSQTVPVGEGKCWISTATISSNTGTAVIAPDKWSTPAVFIEQGEEGVGIESLTKEYAVGTDRKTIPSGPWTELAPEISVTQILWERTKVTLTNGMTEYTGYAPVTGNDGSPAPEVMVKYAWSKSNKIPPKPAFWVWRNSLMVFSNKLVGNPHETWMSSQDTKPAGQWYLWMRTSSDGGKTWSRGQCISGDDAATFNIDGPMSFVTDRGMVVDSTSLSFSITRVNGLEGTCVWTLDEESLQLGVRFNGNSTEGTGDTVDVVIPPQTTIKAIFITATVGGLVRDRRAGAINKTVSIEYFGTYPRTLADGSVINQPETAKDGKPFTTGDHFTFLYTVENTGENLSTIYAYVVTGENTGVWVDTSNPNEYESVLEDLMYQIVMDGVYDITNAANNGDYQPVNNGKAWSMFMGIGAVQVVAQKIFAQYIKMTGAIYGGGFTKEGKLDGTGKPGFHMSAITGLMQAFGGIFNNITANDGVFTGSFQASAFRTIEEQQEISSDNLKLEYQNPWNNMIGFSQYGFKRLDGDQINGSDFFSNNRVFHDGPIGVFYVENFFVLFAMSSSTYFEGNMFFKGHINNDNAGFITWDPASGITPSFTEPRTAAFLQGYNWSLMQTGKRRGSDNMPYYETYFISEKTNTLSIVGLPEATKYAWYAGYYGAFTIEAEEAYVFIYSYSGSTGEEYSFIKKFKVSKSGNEYECSYISDIDISAYFEEEVSVQGVFYAAKDLSSEQPEILPYLFVKLAYKLLVFSVDSEFNILELIGQYEIQNTGNVVYFEHASDIRTQYNSEYDVIEIFIPYSYHYYYCGLFDCKAKTFTNGPETSNARKIMTIENNRILRYSNSDATVYIERLHKKNDGAFEYETIETIPPRAGEYYPQKYFYHKNFVYGTRLANKDGYERYKNIEFEQISKHCIEPIQTTYENLPNMVNDDFVWTTEFRPDEKRDVESGTILMPDGEYKNISSIYFKNNNMYIGVDEGGLFDTTYVFPESVLSPLEIKNLVLAKKDESIETSNIYPAKEGMDIGSISNPFGELFVSGINAENLPNSPDGLESGYIYVDQSTKTLKVK